MRLALIFAILVQFSAVGVLSARERFDPDARAKAIAPFVEEETAFVAHVDLSRLDAKAPFDLLEQVLPIPVARLRSVEKLVIGSLEAVVRTGVDEFYLVAPFFGLIEPQRLFAVVPVSAGGQERALRAALRLQDNEGRMIHGSLVYQIPKPIPGQPRHPLEFQSEERPELSAAFRAAGDSAVQVLFIPPRATRRVIGELHPRLPEQLGGGPSSTLTRGVGWAAAGINFAPRQSLRLVIQSDDAPAAKALHVKLADLKRLAGNSKQVREVVPGFDKIASWLTPKLENDRLVLAMDETTGIDKLLPLLDSNRISAGQNITIRNLKRIAQAIHNYDAAKKHFPLPAHNSPEGKPLLSWRVLILPYLGERKLFGQFQLDEVWDSPHNRTLIDKMPAVYRLPISKHKGPGRTNYLLPVGNGAAFSADEPTKFEDIKDGFHNTIMVVEVDDKHAVVWTKPDDWRFDPDKPAEGLGRFFAGGFNAAFCDGSVSLLKLSQDAKNLRALFTRSGDDRGTR